MRPPSVNKVAPLTHALRSLQSWFSIGAIKGTLLLQGQAHVSEDSAPLKIAAAVTGSARALTEKDAIDIWIARWLRVRQKDLLIRYRCDSRRLYEIWWGERFPGSRRKATEQFRALHPGLADRTVFGYRRIPRSAFNPMQSDLFD